MQKFNLLIMAILFSVSSLLAQEKVTVSGSVKNEKGKALSGTNIILQGTKKGGVSDANGLFKIGNVIEGTYTIVVSHTGYKSESRRIKVKSGMRPVSIQLKRKVKSLKQTVITGEREKRQAEETLKLLAPIKDVPLTTSTIGADLLEQRQITDVGEAVRYSTGIAPVDRYGGFQTFKMRGFGQPVILVDGVRDERMNFSNSAPVTSLAAVEKIEYLKGPASILYGHSAVGGVLNIIRKKPSDEFKANFAATYGSWETKELTMGAGGALSDKVNFRLDFGSADREGWRDYATKTLNGYMRLDYNINDNNDLSFTFGGNKDFYATETGIPTLTNDVFDAANDQLLYNKGDYPAGYDREQRYNDPSDFLKHDNYNVSLEYNHKYSDNASIKYKASYSHDIIDYFSTEFLSYLTSDDPIYSTYYLKNGAKKYICVDSLNRAFPFKFSHHTNTFQHFIDYNKTFNTGGLKHKLLAGYSMMYIDRTSYKSKTFSDMEGDGLFATVAFVNPILNQGDIQTKFSSAAIYNEMLNSLYVQDLVEILPSLKALLGLRGDFYDMDFKTSLVKDGIEEYDYSDVTNQKKFALTYRAGLVFQPIESLSLYTSYANFFRPTRRAYDLQSIYIDQDGNEFDPGTNPYFDPQTGYQLEGGVKYDLNSKLQVNSSVFYIEKKNIVEWLGQTENNVNLYGQVGVVNSKGFDVDIATQPVDGLNLIAGYERTIAQYKEFSTNKYIDNTKKDNYLRFVPKDRFFAWAHYTVQEGFAKNFNLGIGYEYVGEKFTSGSNAYSLPAYNLIDANIGYSINNIFMKFAINNIANEEYFNGAIYGNQFTSAPARNYKLTVGVKL